MTAKIKASGDGLKVTIGNAAEDALEINQTAKTIAALAPYLLKGDIAAQSLTGNGYVKLASGLIIQWGVSPTFVNGNATVTFPIPFPTICRAVYQTVSLDGLWSLGVVAGGNTSQTINCQNNGGYPAPSGAAWYIAIGY